jgi:hypothetical protein
VAEEAAAREAEERVIYAEIEAVESVADEEEEEEEEAATDDDDDDDNDDVFDA